MVSYEKGCFIAVRSYDEPFYIAKCLEQIPVKFSVSKYKIKWLEKIKVFKDKSIYNLSYDDLIHNETIICKVTITKISRFRFILNTSEEKRIMSTISSCSNEESGEAESVEEVNENLIHQQQSLTQKELVSEDEINKNQTQLIPKTAWNEVNIVDMNYFKETSSIFNDKPLSVSLQTYLKATTMSETINTAQEGEINAKSLENIQNTGTVEKEKESDEYLYLIEDVNCFKENTMPLVPSQKPINQEKEKTFIELKNAEIFTNSPNNSVSIDNELTTETIPLQIENLDGFTDVQSDCEYSQAFHDFSPSGSEYLPPTDSSEDQESDIELPLQNIINYSYDPKHPHKEEDKGKSNIKKRTEIAVSKMPLKNKKRKGNRKNSLSSESTSSDISIETENIFVRCTKKTDENIRVYDKRHNCYFCNKLVCKITRHLESVHNKELEVSKLLALNVKDLKRKEGFLCILRAGDYFHNCEVIGTKSGELILSRRPTNKEKCLSYKKYGPCPNCLGFFLLTTLWNHVKHHCPKRKKAPEKLSENINNSILRRDVRGESIALLGNVFSEYSTDYVVNIVSSFRDDDIGSVCKEDELIMKFGLLLFEKYNRHQYEYIRQSMRQLGRLLLTIEEVNGSKLSLQKCILPINYDLLITAVKRLCVSQRTEVHQLDYGIPSLALKLGHSLRKCALIARGIALRKGDLQTDKQMEGFLDLMSIEWNARVSSAALRTLRHKKMSAPELLPLTDDLVTLNKYLETLIKEGCGKINNSFNPQLWARLASATLCRIILFNKRRSGEASRMTITQYAARPDWKEQSTSELTATLTPLEMNLANRLTIVEVPGKSRSLMKVPILLTIDMKTAIDTLIETRIPSGISNDNIYVFARGNMSEGYLRGHDCLRLFCNEANLQKPRLITSTKLRKYIATVVQLFDLKENECDWLARHLGHDIRVHREFYRLQESAVELTKVSRILLAVDKGQANEFRGQSLQDINVSDLPNAEESDCESEEDTANNLVENPVSVTSDDVVSRTERSKGVKPSGRRPWGKDEKQTVLEFFRFKIRKSIVPNKSDIEECLDKNAEVLKNRTWRDVKYCVYNQIKLMKKQNQK